MADELWREVAAVAKAMGTNRSEVLRAFARWYVGKEGAQLPGRPAS